MARSPARFICYSLWLWFGVTQGVKWEKWEIRHHLGSMKMDCYRLGISICAYAIPIEVGPPRKTHFSHFGLPGRQVGVESSSGVKLQPLPPPARQNREKMGGVRYAVASRWAQGGRRWNSFAGSMTATIRPSQSMAPRIARISGCPNTYSRSQWYCRAHVSANAPSPNDRWLYA